MTRVKIFAAALASLAAVGATVALMAEDGHEEGGHEEAEGHVDKHDQHGHEAALSITPEQAVKLALPVVKVDSGPIDRTIAMLGRVLLNPDRSLHLHSRYPGIVREVIKATGDSVRAGDTLARIENNVGQVYELVSAIDGTVLERRIAEGQSVNEQIEAFTIADISDVLVSLIAYPRDVQHLKLGMKVYVDDPDGHAPLTGEIRYVSPVLDEHTRTGQAQFLVTNAEGHLRPGQFVIGYVIVGQKSVSTRLPINVVPANRGERSIKLFARSGEAFSIKDVTLGLRDSQFVEIASGLEPGAEVIAAPTREIERLIEDREGKDGK